LVLLLVLDLPFFDYENEDEDEPIAQPATIRTDSYRPPSSCHPPFSVATSLETPVFCGWLRRRIASLTPEKHLQPRTTRTMRTKMDRLPSGCTSLCTQLLYIRVFGVFRGLNCPFQANCIMTSKPQTTLCTHSNPSLFPVLRYWRLFRALPRTD